MVSIQQVSTKYHGNSFLIKKIHQCLHHATPSATSMTRTGPASTLPHMGPYSNNAQSFKHYLTLEAGPHER